MQALGHLECAQGIITEIFGDVAEAADPVVCRTEIEQAALSPQKQQLLARFMNYGCSSDIIERLSTYSEVVLESALANTITLTNPRSPNGVAIRNVKMAAAESKGDWSNWTWNHKQKKTVRAAESKGKPHSKRTRSKWTCSYKQEKTVCRRYRQPGHIARDCTTDIQALAWSDQPAASGECTGSSEVAGTQARPAKRRRRTTKKSHYSSSFSFSVNSDAEQDLVASDRSGEGTGSGEVAGAQAPPAKRQRGTTKKTDISSSLSFSVNSDAEQDLVEQENKTT